MHIRAEDSRFAFALDEKGIVFIDDSGKAEELIRNVQRAKKWKFPSLDVWRDAGRSGIMIGDYEYDPV